MADAEYVEACSANKLVADLMNIWARWRSRISWQVENDRKRSIAALIKVISSTFPSLSALHFNYQQIEFWANVVLKSSE